MGVYGWALSDLCSVEGEQKMLNDLPAKVRYYNVQFVPFSLPIKQPKSYVRRSARLLIRYLILVFFLRFLLIWFFLFVSAYGGTR